MAFFGHPRGLSTLFFTEMWERFSFYGMRALLILFMTASPASGGLGFDAVQAGAIYGLYTSMVYMATLPGGWLADQVLGAQRAVILGGALIASGHFSMAVPSLGMFYLGLVLIVVGTGLLKGNVSVIGRESPNSLYSMKVVTFEEDQGAYDQRDAEGFIKLNALRLRLRAMGGQPNSKSSKK